MSELMPWLMVAASGLCLAAALLHRRAAPICGAAVMAAAMIDASMTGLVHPIAWAGVLMLAGVGMAAWHARSARRAAVGARGVTAGARSVPAGARGVSDALATPRARLLDRAVPALCAASYPVMALQLLQHGGGHPAHGTHTATVAAGGGDQLASMSVAVAHAGHSHDGSTLFVAVTVVALVFAAVFAVAAGAALLRRRLPHALESLGMAAMLVVMTMH
ncbi:hypothetical protein [Gulosibacter sp. ACHW.36C]|uniref:DUF5134 domain-containing protein n=1 Tax=Gulosibacter sediminis TaxID=1729695 RepID=A0ABY4MXM0_9MICO|nr:hypothetical protein [Gulosibacter sediminis]UQN15183.1 hypothetical protein M3M28_01560 [Gulosibacter sediminis]